MATIEWDELTPTGDSYLSDLANKWRSVKSNVDTALQQHFYWSDSTSSAGEPRFSTTTPGSCRAYVGTRSTVSNTGRNGSLMVVATPIEAGGFTEYRLLTFFSGQSFVVSSASAIQSYRTPS